MNISYITTYNAADVHQWSGLGYYIAKALQQQGAEIDFINVQVPLPKYAELKTRVYRKLGRSFLPERAPAFVRQQAANAQKLITPATDIVFAPSTLPLALVKTGKPKVFYTDATFAGMLNYYPYFTGLAAESIRHGNYIEQAALDSCTLGIYSSAWAAQTAVDNYRTNAAKIQVVPFGANIQSSPTIAGINEIINKKEHDVCHLLFVGVEWERKGGDIAVDTARLLHEKGFPVVLHIAGVGQHDVPDMPYIKHHGFISKKTPEGARELDALFMQAHFLLLPSRADCTPVVYAEANSFGLPCITTRTGGIPSVITDDVNGQMFEPEDGAAVYAQYIKEVFENRSRYLSLARTSFNQYATRLNWETSGKAIMDLLRAL